MIRRLLGETITIARICEDGRTADDGPRQLFVVTHTPFDSDRLQVVEKNTDGSFGKKYRIVIKEVAVDQVDVQTTPELVIKLLQQQHKADKEAIAMLLARCIKAETQAGA